MFKVKNVKTNEIIQVLSTYCDEYGKAWFLIWENDGWRWRAADKFCPPNYVSKKKVVVCGSRDFQNYALLRETLDTIKGQIGEIVCGEARGADTLGKAYAVENHINVKSFPANWTMYGAQAGFIRNCDMADYADMCVAFWDGTSPGTKHMLDYMNKLGKETIVIRYGVKEKED